KNAPAILSHFPVSDATGQSIGIEVLNGQIKVSYNNNYGVLTNDPCFEWQTTNMSNYLCLTPDNAPSQDGNYFSGQSPSQGTGLVAIPGSFTPRDRFVRVATMKNWAKPVATAEEVTNLAFHILNTVDIPLGVINAGGTDQDYTQWTIVADMTNLIFYVRMYDSPQVHSIDLNSLDFDNLDGKLYTVPTSSIATMISVDKIALGKIEVS
ncbi:MAG: linear amide C-N hydrolase, partial [Algicola sp.]|nr:linear amide C-N hydrolase [Algicola sp.]